MGKRVQRPFLVEQEVTVELLDKSTDSDTTASFYVPFEIDEDGIESTADAVRALRAKQVPGKFRVIQECAVINLELEQVTRVKLTTR